MLSAIDKWHKTYIGYVVFGLAELAIAYFFASLAIPSAHTWEWFLAACFSLGVVHNAGLLVLKISHDITAKASKSR